MRIIDVLTFVALSYTSIAYASPALGVADQVNGETLAPDTVPWKRAKLDQGPPNWRRSEQPDAPYWKRTEQGETPPGWRRASARAPK
ncbi:hypothetical protein CPB83DRAFT_860284 [Crepidotus variabilis]|uniref:Uncharacterized protein n=1 Tax=Crepidotus variabilis TaxID=179855 RepID=A0A9P6JL95_9AGAR|nr:hypothetical protein CPB83DRAFT_860284 [Crepidotus variabilis]